MLGAKYTNAKEAREFLFKAMQKEQEALQKMDDAQKINGFAETQARTTAILNEMKADLSGALNLTHITPPVPPHT